MSQYKLCQKCNSAFDSLLPFEEWPFCPECAAEGFQQRALDAERRLEDEKRMAYQKGIQDQMGHNEGAIMISDLTEQCQLLSAAKQSAERELGEVKASYKPLLHYCDHGIGCRAGTPWMGPPLDCTCGLDAPKSKLEGRKE